MTIKATLDDVLLPKKKHLGLVDINRIKVGERLRETNIGGVHAIKTSFEVLGQLAPVILSTDDNLLAGAHRLQAAKELQWHHIEAMSLDVSHYSPELGGLVLKQVEIDENLQRSDLSEAQRVKFMGKRVEVTEERIARQHFERAEREKKKADAERAAALAVIKKAKDDEEKAKLQAEFNAKEKVRALAAQKKKRAENNVAFLSGTPDKNTTSVNGPTIRGTTDVIAKELGLKPHRVRDLISFRNQVGDDILDLFEGTRLATNAEMRGYIELKKKFPERAAKLVELNTRLKSEGKLTHMYSPCRELGILVKEQNDRERTLRMGTDEGKLEDLRKASQEVMGALEKLRGVVARQLPDNKSKLSDVPGIVEAFVKVHQRINSMTKPPQQKRTGTEHRYGQETEGPSRADAAKELEQHADEIEKVLAKKNKKAVKSSKKVSKSKVGKKPA